MSVLLSVACAFPLAAQGGLALGGRAGADDSGPAPAAPVAPGRASPALGAAPDLLLFVLDDVGVQDLIAVRDAGWLPNLTALAQRGFTFRDCSSAPICSPTRRMLYYGEFYSRQSDTACEPADGREPPPGAVSIAQVLAGVGYAPAFLGKWHVGSNPVGPWQETLIYRGWPTCRWLPLTVGDCGGNGYGFWRYIVGSTDMLTLEYQPRIQLDDFFDVWPTPGGDAPRFLVCSFQLAHAPFHLPPAGLLPPGYPRVGVNTNRERYEAMIASIDWQIGEMLRQVDLARTVVCVVGDNGTPREVSSNPSHAKTTTFQGGVHVPLFFAGAGIPVGQSTAIVSVVDVFATFAELAGATPPPTDSRSLAPLMNGTAARVHDYLAFGIQGDNPQFQDDLAVRSARYKYRRTRANASQRWVEELYDLLVDPGETTDVSALPRHAARIAAHRAVLEAELP